MTPEIWQAKKVVDSTLHPGEKLLEWKDGYNCSGNMHKQRLYRKSGSFANLRPDTGKPVFLPFRMSCFVISNLVVTAGMLTPGLGVCSRHI